ncbi:reverse transcriptase domain-containing protein [Tanacetum coccineum]|uniref:Reverse transcriptase domain-containing protein n=1 Tax=Tanacetum coccineum TaxID=301880 RepID=A0ABQ5G2T8_9ASTR
MRLWDGRGDVLRSCCKHERNKSMSRKGERSHEVAISKNAERGTKPQWKASKLEQIFIKVHGEIPTFLYDFEKLHKKERLPMDRISEKSIPGDEKTYHRASAPHSAKAKGRTDNALKVPEINYNSMEKLILSLVHTSRRLRRYFQAYTVVVITDQPIKQILSRPENVERMAKWHFELAAEEDSSPTPEPWILFTDGSSCLEVSGAGLILINPEGMEFTYALMFKFDASNNEAEYEALVAGIFAHLTKQVLVEVLKEKSIEKKEILAVVEEEGYFWMTPLLEYLTDGTLPAEAKKARAIKIKLRQYVVIGGILYRKSFLEPWLRGVSSTPAEIRDERNSWGELQHALWQGNVMIAKSIGQYPKTPQQKLTPITSPWPFYKWRIDISGLFPEVQGRMKFLIVAIDYFTKWIKAKPIATITGNQIKKYVWDNITRTGDTPFSLTSDTEAVIPIEIGMPLLRFAEVNQTQNDEALLLNLDMLEEKRVKAAIREAKSKTRMEKYYNAKIQKRRHTSVNLEYEGLEEMLPLTSIMFLALGWHLEEIHMTWAHLEKKRTRLRLYTIYLEEGDGIAGFKRQRRDFYGDDVMDLTTVSGRS